MQRAIEHTLRSCSNDMNILPITPTVSPDEIVFSPNYNEKQQKKTITVLPVLPTNREEKKKESGNRLISSSKGVVNNKKTTETYHQRSTKKGPKVS